MFTRILYGLAIVLVIISAAKSKEKTLRALKKSWKSFEAMMPQLMAIIMIIGLTLSWLNPELISRVIGGESGLVGMIIAGAIGSVTLIPAFVAFPLASALLDAGAGTMQIVAFISTLMMVGVVTLPVEMRTFGKKITFTRNIMAFGLSFVVAILMGVIL